MIRSLLWRLLRLDRPSPRLIDHGSPDADAQWWQDLARVRENESVAACYAIIDPYTASQIMRAAHRAHAGGEWEPWAERAREQAGYAGLTER